MGRSGRSFCAAQLNLAVAWTSRAAYPYGQVLRARLERRTRISGAKVGCGCAIGRRSRATDRCMAKTASSVRCVAALCAVHIKLAGDTLAACLAPFVVNGCTVRIAGSGSVAERLLARKRGRSGALVAASTTEHAAPTQLPPPRWTYCRRVQRAADDKTSLLLFGREQYSAGKAFSSVRNVVTAQ